VNQELDYQLQPMKLGHAGQTDLFDAIPGSHSSSQKPFHEADKSNSWSPQFVLFAPICLRTQIPSISSNQDSEYYTDPGSLQLILDLSIALIFSFKHNILYFT
jgi:hypothetical protein